MGLHADMEAQQVCEQLYQLIIVLVSVRDHTCPAAWPPFSLFSLVFCSLRPRAAGARTLQNALPGRRACACAPAQQTWFRQEAGCADKVLTACVSLPLSVRACVLACLHAPAIAANTQVVGFVAGYALESFRVTVYAVFGGVIVASAICVPDWGIFKSECCP